MKHRIRAAAIITKDNKILLVKHVHPVSGRTWWVPPGGGIEENDQSIFDCAKRETWEETNLTIEASDIIYIREFFDTENQKLNIEFFVLADSHSGKIGLDNIAGTGPDDQYIKELKWLSRYEIQNMTVHPEILKNDFWQDFKKNFPHVKYLGRQT